MLCKNCGYESNDELKYCPRCGSPIDSGGDSTEDVYVSAITYYGEKGDTDTVVSLSDEITRAVANLLRIHHKTFLRWVTE